MPKSAATVAVATPCWPAPVSAISRLFFSRRATSACPIVLLILGAGVEQVLALEEDAGTAEPPREAAGEVEPGRPSGVLAEPARELALEGGVAGQARVGPLELEELRHEGFGDVPAPVLAEVPVLVRQPWRGG